MGHWKLDPQAIQGVLTKMTPDVKALADVLKQDALEAIPSDLEPGSPVTAKAAAAMAFLLADQGDEMQKIVTHVGACLQGVTNATIAYARGSEAQAAAFQRAMVNAARTGDFSYFEKHGYKGK